MTTSDETSGGGCDRNLFLKLAQLSQQSIENRRSYEWKVAFGLWAGIGLFTWFAVQNRLVPGKPIWIVVAYAAVLVIWSVLWQLPLHRAYEQDKRWKHYFADRAESRSDSLTADPRLSPPNCWVALRSLWFWGQVLMTAVFLSVSFCLVTGASAASAAAVGDRVSDQNLTMLIQVLRDLAAKSNVGT